MSTSSTPGSAIRVAALVQLTSNCGRSLRRWLSAQTARAGLSDSEFLLLFSCGQADPRGRHQTDLAQSIGLSPAQVSGVVERLRSRGLLMAQRCPQDRRRQLWQLTPQGRDSTKTVLQSLAPVAAQLDALCGPQQQQLAAELLRSLAVATGSELPPGLPAWMESSWLKTSPHKQAS